MSRAVRIEYEGAFYHVMARGVARLPTFLDDEDRRTFLRKLGRLVERGVLEVHAYCLMPNHYHLLLMSRTVSNVECLLTARRRRDRLPE